MPIGIEEMIFAKGPDGSAPLSVKPTPVVVLVGPNNSGKSLALREVEAFCSTANPKTLVLSDVKLAYPQSLEEALSLLEKFKTEPPPGKIIQNGRFQVRYYTPGSSETNEVDIKTLEHCVQNKNEEFLASQIIKWYTIRLDGRTRLSLADGQPTADLKGAPTSHIMALFQDDSKRERVRGLTKEALGRYFTIDPTVMSEFSIRLSRRPPVDSREEQGLDAISRKFHSEAQPISEFSDGVNAFVGLTAAVMSLDHRIMMIDEPEAFLHPTLARLLARNLASIAVERGATLLVATHSSPFLLGAMDSQAGVTLIRLTYDGRAATTRMLESDQVSHLAKSPILKAARVLDALFSRAAVVVEGDTDRVFYEAVNEKMNDDGRGIDQCLFINAQNKQTLYKIAGPLRRMGIPTAVAADFDIVNLHERQWRRLLDSVGVTDAEPLCQARSSIMAELNRPKASGGDPNHDQGIGALVESREAASVLVGRLKEHGLFVVEGGELETWLPGRADKIWIEGALEYLDKYPQSARLDGVREFLGSVRAWIDGAEGGALRN